MLTAFQNETWVTENVEVRTINGWVNIYDMTMEEDLLVYDFINEKFTCSTIQKFSTCEYDGVVHRYRNDEDINTQVFAKNLRTIHPMTKREDVSYEGKLFSIEPNHGMLIIRGFTSYHGNNQDYIIII